MTSNPMCAWIKVDGEMESGIKYLTVLLSRILYSYELIVSKSYISDIINNINLQFQLLRQEATYFFGFLAINLKRMISPSATT